MKHRRRYLGKWGAPNDYIADLLQEIVAIEIKIESVMAKFKVRQNRSQIDAASAANALQNQSPEMAESIRKFYTK